MWTFRYLARGRIYRRVSAPFVDRTCLNPGSSSIRINISVPAQPSVISSIEPSADAAADAVLFIDDSDDDNAADNDA